MGSTGAAERLGLPMLYLAGEVRVRVLAFIPRRPRSPSRRGGISLAWWIGSVPLRSDENRLTNEGADVVFDGIGGTHMWRSRKALRPGGKVVVYGLHPRYVGDDWLQVVPGVVMARGEGSA